MGEFCDLVGDTEEGHVQRLFHPQQIWTESYRFQIKRPNHHLNPTLLQIMAIL